MGAGGTSQVSMPGTAQPPPGGKDTGFQQQWSHDSAELVCQHSAAFAEPPRELQTKYIQAQLQHCSVREGLRPHEFRRVSEQLLEGGRGLGWIQSFRGDRFLLGDWDRPLRPIGKAIFSICSANAY